MKQRHDVIFSVCRHLIHCLNTTPTSHLERFISNTSSYFILSLQRSKKCFAFVFAFGSVRFWLSLLFARCFVMWFQCTLTSSVTPAEHNVVYF